MIDQGELDCAVFYDGSSLSLSGQTYTRYPT